jgi:hypothetical protein
MERWKERLELEEKTPFGHKLRGRRMKCEEWIVFFKNAGDEYGLQ